MYKNMTFADEALCVRQAVNLPGLFGPLTPGEFCERYGVPSARQAVRLDAYIVICTDGLIRPRSPSEFSAA